MSKNGTCKSAVNMHVVPFSFVDRHMLQLATTTLRPLVLEKIKCAGPIFFKRLLLRHAAFAALPKPLRGKNLMLAASTLGLVTRVKTVRVDVVTIKEECALAGARNKMHMGPDIGKECLRVVVHKKKMETMYQAYRRKCATNRCCRCDSSLEGIFQ